VYGSSCKLFGRTSPQSGKSAVRPHDHDLLAQVVGSTHIEISSSPALSQASLDVKRPGAEARPAFMMTPCWACVLGEGKMLYTFRRSSGTGSRRGRCRSASRSGGTGGNLRHDYHSINNGYKQL
jgi:hypothetical protein